MHIPPWYWFSLSPDGESVPVLHIGRAYNARDAAATLGLSEGVLNLRVREGIIVPMFPNGDRRYSGYELARLLGWPVSDDPKDYMFRKDAVESGKAKRRVRVVR